MGQGKSIGAVTERRYAAPHFILTLSVYFFRVGLCSLLTSLVQAMWQHCGHWMRSHHVKCIDRMDSGPRDHHQGTCVKTHLSERDQRLTLQHVASRGGSNQDQIGKISGERGSALCNRGIVAHDQRVIVTIDRSSPNRTVDIFCAENPYKYRCSSYVSLTLD